MNGPPGGYRRRATGAILASGGSMTMTTATEPHPTSVLHRGLSILECFDSAQGIRGIALTELAGMTGLPKATVHRLCAQLVDFGYLTKSNGLYYLGYRI